ncbi:hypothetical protein ILUMI_01675 [Ignelater luminosus]|uniref:Isopropylmalate dehydrogenase-like domain-containing protein n=1 Tax=Ignelater luminosus TaxID=2038154 RepID=A0A8K0DJP7_IGNLU|nr:hypothetical protein ILUMI_01675 [Ignelater luminosus]
MMKRLLHLKHLWLHQRRITHSLSSFCISRLEEPHKTPLKQEFCKLPVPLYGGRYLVTMISGAGIGPELMGYVIDIFRHITAPVDFEYIEVDSMDDVSNAILSIKRNRAAIKSNIENISGIIADGSPNVAIRQSLDLYLNTVHCKPYCLDNAKHNDVDIVLIRQNTEGEYAMLEHESVKGVVESLKIITRLNSERIAKRAFEFATIHNRKKVTVVHKANIMFTSIKRTSNKKVDQADNGFDEQNSDNEEVELYEEESEEMQKKEQLTVSKGSKRKRNRILRMKGNQYARFRRPKGQKLTSQDTGRQERNLEQSCNLKTCKTSSEVLQYHFEN